MLPDPSRRKEALLRVLNRKFTRGSGSGPDRQGLTEARDLAQAFRSEGQSFYAGFIIADVLEALAFELGELDAVGGVGDVEVKDGPDEGQAAGLAGEAADHLGARLTSPSDLSSRFVDRHLRRCLVG
jgi:hypothetical protein